jgi:hypothetical protein
MQFSIGPMQGFSDAHRLIDDSLMLSAMRTLVFWSTTHMMLFFCILEVAELHRLVSQDQREMYVRL